MEDFKKHIINLRKYPEWRYYQKQWDDFIDSMNNIDDISDEVDLKAKQRAKKLILDHFNRINGFKIINKDNNDYE